MFPWLCAFGIDIRKYLRDDLNSEVDAPTKFKWTLNFLRNVWESNKECQIFTSRNPQNGAIWVTLRLVIHLMQNVHNDDVFVKDWWLALKHQGHGLLVKSSQSAWCGFMMIRFDGKTLIWKLSSHANTVHSLDPVSSRETPRNSAEYNLSNGAFELKYKILWARWTIALAFWDDLNQERGILDRVFGMIVHSFHSEGDTIRLVESTDGVSCLTPHRWMYDFAWIVNGSTKVNRNGNEVDHELSKSPFQILMQIMLHRPHSGISRFHLIIHTIFLVHSARSSSNSE
jgi:hypothetical protein